jgi:cytochrome c oxidase subunit II
MHVALMMAFVVAASLIFHFLSPWRATPIASNWGFIDDTLALTFWVTSAGFVAVILFMAYCLYRFAHRYGRRSAYEPENRKLELLLGGVTTIGVVLLLAPGLSVWGQYIDPPRNAIEVEAVGVQWSWSFRLPGADGQFGASDVRFVEGSNMLGVNPADQRGRDDLIVSNGELHVPLGKPVKVLLRSIDVVHDFYVPEIRAKMDLVPGMETFFWFTPTKAGRFEILCVAYCGVGHPQMRGALFIESESDYRNWQAAQRTFAQTQGNDAARGSRPPGDAL